MSTLPARFDSVEHLEDVMTTPSAPLVAALRGVPGDILVLGVGGKMGPTLARLAKRAAPDKRVIGVARFSRAGPAGHAASATASNASSPTCCRASSSPRCPTCPTSCSWPGASSAPAAASG